MKYEKPPVSLDHLQQSEVYKMIHNMEQTPVKRVEMRTPAIAEADYREVDLHYLRLKIYTRKRRQRYHSS
jgi:hypothetical protein